MNETSSESRYDDILRFDFIVWAILSWFASATLSYLWHTHGELSKPPGRTLYFSFLCEWVESTAFLIATFVSNSGAEHISTVSVANNGVCATFTALLLAADFAAQCWRLALFVDIVAIYRNPFDPTRHSNKEHIVIWTLSVTLFAMVQSVYGDICWPDLVHRVFESDWHVHQDDKTDPGMPLSVVFIALVLPFCISVVRELGLG